MRKTLKIGLVIGITLAFLTPVSLVIADDAPLVNVFSPNGSEVVAGEIAILWSAVDDVTMDLNGTILVEYSPDNGVNWSVIASGQANTGSYLWNTTVVPDGDLYLIRVSAMDESNNTGSDTSNSTFSIDNIDTVPPQVSVIYPIGGEVVVGAITILWSAVDDKTVDLNGTILVEYSPDNGVNWSVIASGQANTGSYLWNTTVVPDGDLYLIRVSATDQAGNVGSDASDSPFSVDNIDSVLPQVSVIYPSGGEIVAGEISILWSAVDDVTMDLNGSILVEYSSDGGSNWSVIASQLNNTGLYVWNTTVVPDGDLYLIRVSATDESNNTGSDVSDSVFSIDNFDTVPPQVLVIYPNGGEGLVGDVAILWSASDDVTMDLNGTILVEYSPDNGVNWSVIASGQANTGSYLWNTTVVPDGDLYLIRVSATDESNNTGSDVSDSVFSIDNFDTVPPQVLVIYPNGGEGLVGDVAILWSASDDVTMDLNGTILVEYSPDNGVNWSVIASGQANTGSYLWNTTVVPDGDLYLIRVSATDESSNTGSDTSDSTFSLLNNYNYPPIIPQIIGPSAVGNGISFDFTANTTDPEGDQIYYLFDWGNGNISGWLGPVNSSESVNAFYTWRDDGNYTIRVKAKDIFESESNWSAAHPISIAEQINFSNVKLGHVYFKLFSFNRSFIFSDFLARLGVVIILTSHPMELEAYATDVVQSVTFKVENQLQVETMEIIDDNRSDGFSCSMNVSRGPYVLNITAYDANGLLIDHYSLFTVFFIRIGRYAMGSSGEGRLSRLRSIHPLRH